MILFPSWLIKKKCFSVIWFGWLPSLRLLSSILLWHRPHSSSLTYRILSRHGRALNHLNKFIEIVLISLISHVIDHAHTLESLFRFQFSFNECYQFTEWLPLISDLTYNTVEGCQVGTLVDVGKHFVLTDILIYILYLVYFVNLINEKWVCIPANIDVDGQCVK